MFTVTLSHSSKSSKWLFPQEFPLPKIQYAFLVSTIMIIPGDLLFVTSYPEL